MVAASFANTRSALRDLDSANFVRAGRGALVGTFQWKNTTYQALAPVIILCETGRHTRQPQSLPVPRQAWGLRLFGNLFRALIEPLQKPSRVVHVLLRQSPFVFAAVHEQQRSERNVFCVASLMSRVTKCLS